MDTTSGQWLAGRRMAYVIVLLDDYSRAILAATGGHGRLEAGRTCGCWSKAWGGTGRRGAVQRQRLDLPHHAPRRRPLLRLSSRGAGRRGADQLARALGELGAVLLTHTPGNARAKGKLERWNRFFQERVLADGPYPSVAALDAALQAWVAHYNARHRHRPDPAASRRHAWLGTSAPTAGGTRPLGDVCALRETRKVAKDHTISLDGVTYGLPREPNLVAYTVELRIRPGPERPRLARRPGSSPSCHTTRPRPRTASASTTCSVASCPSWSPSNPGPQGAPPGGLAAAAQVGPSSRTNEL